jgi:hypothetical protein
MTTTEAAGIFKKGDIIALLRPDGTNVTKTIRRIDELMPLLTRDELKELHHRMTIETLASADPARRREIVSTMDVCPCCDRWLGHNRPPADDGDPSYRRQTSFDLDR